MTTATLHWIDDDWKLRAAVLGAPPVPGSSTGVAIAALLQARLEKYGLIKEKISNACIDQGANYQKALRQVYNVSVLDCICHLLDHVMDDVAADVFPEIITWANRLVDVCKNSSTARRALEAVQVAAGRPKLALKRASATRWAFFIIVFKRILECWPDLEIAALRDEKIGECWLNAPSQYQLECIVAILEHVRERITYFQSQYSSVIGALFPALMELYRFAKKDAPRDASERSRYANRLHKSLRSKLKDRIKFDKTIPLQWLIASVLDPRFKMMTFVAQDLPTPLDRSIPKVLRETHKKIKEELEALESLPGNYARLGEHGVLDLELLDLEPAVDAPARLPEPPAKRVYAEDFAADLRMFGVRAQEELDKRNELPPAQLGWLDQWTRYQQEPQIQLAADPLLWWLNNQAKFPIVAKMARKYLAMQVSGAAAERVWSLAGNVETKKRMGLTPETLDIILFIKCNM